MAGGYQVMRVPVAPESALEGRSYDYADSFELRSERPDGHSAEEWVRAGLEQAPAAVRGLIRLVHRHVARFDLGPTDAAHVLGWQVAVSRPDLLKMHVEGSLLDAVIVARTGPGTARLTTFLFYKRPAARALWVVIGPLHRAIAPLLLRRAAARLLPTDLVTAPAG